MMMFDFMVKYHRFGMKSWKGILEAIGKIFKVLNMLL